LSDKPWALVPTHNRCQSRRARSAATGLGSPRVSDLPHETTAPLSPDHKQFPVRQVCPTATAISTSLTDDPADTSFVLARLPGADGVRVVASVR